MGRPESAPQTAERGATEWARRSSTRTVGPTEHAGTNEGGTIGGPEFSGAVPTSWRLERNSRQVTFAECRELSVFSETTSARVSAPHAHPAWTLFLPVDGGTVTVIAPDPVQVHNEGVLIAPQSQYRAATDGPHV